MRDIPSDSRDESKGAAPDRDRVRELLRLPAIAAQGRERLIGVAMHLFYRHGINAVGLDWILADAGVSKTTFYKHFTGKDDLVVQALAPGVPLPGVPGSDVRGLLTSRVRSRPAARSC
jgi:hypothetical protein